MMSIAPPSDQKKARPRRSPASASQSYSIRDASQLQESKRDAQKLPLQRDECAKHHDTSKNPSPARIKYLRQQSRLSSQRAAERVAPESFETWLRNFEARIARSKQQQFYEVVDDDEGTQS
jgi:hypothetical protein